MGLNGLKEYLEESLNIRKMHSLYVGQAKEKNEADKICSEDFYRKIFNNNYNLDFHMPKNSNSIIVLRTRI